MSQIKNAFGFIDECLGGLSRKGKCDRDLVVLTFSRPSTWASRVSREYDSFARSLWGGIPGASTQDFVKGGHLRTKVSIPLGKVFTPWHVISCLKYNQAWLEALFDAFPSLMDTTSFLDQLRPLIFLLPLCVAGLSAKGLIAIEKYQTVRLFAESMGQELPPAPTQYFEELAPVHRVLRTGSGSKWVYHHVEHTGAEERVYFMSGNHLPFSGQIRTHIRRICKGHGQRTVRNLKFLNTVLQGIKRGCEPAPESVVLAAKERQREILSTPKRLSWADSEELDTFAGRLTKGFLRRTPHFSVGEVSTSASYGHPRSLGGGREAVRELLLESGAGPRELPLISMTRQGEPLHGVCLDNRNEIPIIVKEHLGIRPCAPSEGCASVDAMGDRVSSSPSETGLEGSPTKEAGLTDVASTSVPFRDTDQVSPSGLRSDPPGDQVDAMFEVTRTHALKGAALSDRCRALGLEPDYPLPFLVVDREADPRLGERNPTHAQVEAVLEPLKVRLITKSDAFRQWISKWMQRQMHDFLREMEQFRLIGEPLNGSHLDALYKRTQVLFTPEELSTARWESGDYEAATDNLSMEATKIVFERFLDRLPPHLGYLKPACRAVLYEQVIHYKEVLEHGSVDHSYLQESGQLMGSVLSFPILCAINLWCYAEALEQLLGRRVPIKQLPCLVNGDDFLAFMTPELRQLWVAKVKSVGFKFSVGKNYTSRNFCLINSTLFKVLYLEGGVPVFQRIPFLNIGLLTGQAKVTGRANVRLSPLGSWYNAVMDGAQSKDRAVRRFLHYHREAVRELTWDGQWNIFMPLSRGGLGCDAYVPKDAYSTSFQRQYARFIEQTLLDDHPRKELYPAGLGWTLKAETLLPSLPEERHGLVKAVRLPATGPLLPQHTADTWSSPKAPLLFGLYLQDQDESALRMTPPKRRYLKLFRSAIPEELPVQQLLHPLRVGRIDLSREALRETDEAPPPWGDAAIF